MEAHELVKRMQTGLAAEMHKIADMIAAWDLPANVDGKPGQSFVGLAEHVGSLRRKAWALYYASVSGGVDLTPAGSQTIERMPNGDLVVRVVPDDGKIVGQSVERRADGSLLIRLVNPDAPQRETDAATVARYSRDNEIHYLRKRLDRLETSTLHLPDGTKVEPITPPDELTTVERGLIAMDAAQNTRDEQTGRFYAPHEAPDPVPNAEVAARIASGARFD